MLNPRYASSMTKRLQLRIGEVQLEEVRHAAEIEGMTVSEWVRRTLHRASQRFASSSRDSKLAAIQRASSYAFPTGDIDQMLREIGNGYLSER